MSLRWVPLATIALYPLLPQFLAQAGELSVGAGGFPTIAAALQAAQPGDTVRIPAGTYREHLVLTKPVTLEGVGMPTIDGGGKGDVITVRAPNCRIRGLHVTGSGREILGDTAAIKLEAAGEVVEDCRIDQSLYGIYINAVQHARISNNEIRGIVEMAVGDRGDGIRIWNSAHNRVENNRIEDMRDGIYFDGSPFNEMVGNQIRRVRYGLHYMYSDDNLFRGNRFTETEAGSAVMFSRRVTLRDNLFSGNRGYRAYGLLIKDCEELNVEGNDVAGNRTGIFVDGSTRLRILRNRVVGNDLGLEVRGSTEANHFEGNTIAGNTESIATPTGIGDNTWQGNYWSDYRGYDLDGDGRGDTPHEAGSVFSYLVENFPPARLFLLSPAIQALEFAERTFPMVDAPGIRDTAPAMKPTVASTPIKQQSPWSGGLLAASACALFLGLLPILRARKAFHA